MRWPNLVGVGAGYAKPGFPGKPVRLPGCYSARESEVPASFRILGTVT